MATIYAKPVRELMHEMVKERGIEPGSIVSRDAVRGWFGAHYPKIKAGTIAAHLLRMSVNSKSRMHYGAKEGADDLFFQLDAQHFRLYDPKQDPPPLRNNSEPGVEVLDDAVEPSIEGSQEFTYEKDLENYLARNLHLIEPGLRLYENEGINGRQFPAGGRFIDILAVDGKDNLVVLELKVSKGYDRVVGQLLRYMAWIRRNQAEAGQYVRGIIVARNISDDLLLACSGIKDVQLFEYHLSVTLTEAKR